MDLVIEWRLSLLIYVCVCVIYFLIIVLTYVPFLAQFTVSSVYQYWHIRVPVCNMG
jgi:hypothetical protein